MPEFSVNEHARDVMGLRPTDVVPFDEPCELGYWCPVCRVPAHMGDGHYNDKIHWSEYRGFLWCETCDKDYPSVLCVPLEGLKDPERPWEYVGVEDATNVFLRTVDAAVGEHKPHRGSDVETWLKRRRDENHLDSDIWHVLDIMLDEYRERADTGCDLLEEFTSGPGE